MLAQHSQAQLIDLSGGTPTFQIPNNPFYFIGGRGGGCSGSIILNITYPINGSTFYFPNISPNVTFDMSNARNPSCYYRIVIGGVAYGWNNWANCSNGDGYVNNKVITLPPGSLNIQVAAIDRCGVVYDNDYVNVVYPRKGLAISDTILAAIILLLLFIFIIDSEERV
jgi:hypothetical protein